MTRLARFVLVMVLAEVLVTAVREALFGMWDVLFWLDGSGRAVPIIAGG